MAVQHCSNDAGRCTRVGDDMKKATRSHITPWWGGLVLAGALSSGGAQAANSDAGTFRAKILPGTCSVALDSQKQTIDLGRVGAGSITTTSALLTSDSDQQYIDVTCTGYPSALSKPMLKVTGTDIGSGGNSLFRNGGPNPSTSLGFRVQAVQNGATPNWSAADYMVNNTGYLALPQGNNANKAKIPVRFSMWCMPVSPKTVGDCKSAGVVSAALTFSFDYE